MFNCVLVTFTCGILGRVWYLIVSIPDLCRLSYFSGKEKLFIKRNIKTISLYHCWYNGLEIIFTTSKG